MKLMETTNGINRVYILLKYFIGFIGLRISIVSVTSNNRDLAGAKLWKLKLV